MHTGRARETEVGESRREEPGEAVLPCGEAHHAINWPGHVFEGALQVSRPQDGETNTGKGPEKLEWKGLVSCHGCEGAKGHSSESVNRGTAAENTNR